MLHVHHKTLWRALWFGKCIGEQVILFGRGGNNATLVTPLNIIEEPEVMHQSVGSADFFSQLDAVLAQSLHGNDALLSTAEELHHYCC